MPELSFHRVASLTVEVNLHEHHDPPFKTVTITATDHDGERVNFKLYADIDADLVGQLRETVYRVPA